MSSRPFSLSRSVKKTRPRWSRPRATPFGRTGSPPPSRWRPPSPRAWCSRGPLAASIHRGRAGHRLGVDRRRVHGNSLAASPGRRVPGPAPAACPSSAPERVGLRFAGAQPEKRAQPKAGTAGKAGAWVLSGNSAEAHGGPPPWRPRSPWDFLTVGIPPLGSCLGQPPAPSTRPSSTCRPGLAFGGGHLWVSNQAGNSLTEIDPVTGAWMGSFLGARYGFKHPTAITSAGPDLFVASESGSLSEVRASDGAPYGRSRGAGSASSTRSPWRFRATRSSCSMPVARRPRRPSLVRSPKSMRGPGRLLARCRAPRTRSMTRSRRSRARRIHRRRGQQLGDRS